MDKALNLLKELRSVCGKACPFDTRLDQDGQVFQKCSKKGFLAGQRSSSDRAATCRLAPGPSLTDCFDEIVHLSLEKGRFLPYNKGCRNPYIRRALI